MTPKTRLKVIVGVLILSFVYAVLVQYSPQLARTVALGYICLMLTLLVLISCWKRPPHV